MRRLLTFAMLVALVLPAASAARGRGPSDGTLSVRDARGTISISARGGVIGSFARGSVTITDPVDGDGTGPIVTGDEWSKDRSDTTTSWGGTKVRFRIIGGACEVRMEVRTAANGAEALASVQSHQPSLIVLDLMLPDIDGIEICRRIRQNSDVPILMLTARDEDVDKIIGLEVGADDYMTKPFNPRELVARVKSILRRAAPERKEPESAVLQRGDLVIDAGRREVKVGAEEIQLAPKEFDLLWEL